MECRKNLCIALFFVFMFHVQGVTIAERGRTVSQIIIPRNAPDAIQHAAEELSRHLGKITNSPAVPVTHVPANGTNHIFLDTTANADLTRQCPMADQLKDDGFLIQSENNTVWIIGKNPRGTLYGIYEVLKRYTSIRWLYPGIDGEYFTFQEQIIVPDGKLICNPSFLYRAMAFNSCIITSFLKDSWDWQIQNNMQVNGQSVRYSSVCQREADYMPFFHEE